MATQNQNHHKTEREHMKIHKRFFSVIFPGWEFGAQNKHESFIELLVHESKLLLTCMGFS